MNRRLGVLLFGIVVAVLVPAGTASAHAELLDVSPADGAVLTEAPAEAVLRFSEQVSLTGGSAAVLDDTGAPVSAAAASSTSTSSSPSTEGSATARTRSRGA